MFSHTASLTQSPLSLYLAFQFDLNAHQKKTWSCRTASWGTLRRRHCCRRQPLSFHYFYATIFFSSTTTIQQSIVGSATYSGTRRRHGRQGQNQRVQQHSSDDQSTGMCFTSHYITGLNLYLSIHIYDDIYHMML